MSQVVSKNRLEIDNLCINTMRTLAIDAIEAAKKMGGIQPKEKVEYLELPKPRNFLEQLLDVPEEEARLQLRTAAQELAPGAAKHLGELRTLQQLFEEPALLMMPYRIEIR